MSAWSGKVEVRAEGYELPALGDESNQVVKFVEVTTVTFKNGQLQNAEFDERQLEKDNAKEKSEQGVPAKSDRSGG